MMRLALLTTLTIACGGATAQMPKGPPPEYEDEPGMTDAAPPPAQIAPRNPNDDAPPPVISTPRDASAE